MRLLVTGGVGYIGSHFCCQALAKGHEILVIDNAVSLRKDIIRVIQESAPNQDMALFFDIDLRDKRAVEQFFNTNKPIDAVVHFAALTDARASVSEVCTYYHNNVGGSINLLSAMEKANIKRMVFSSTAGVYTPDAPQPCCENSKVEPVTPYGKSKYMVETMLSDIVAASDDFRAVSLRYFNVAGLGNTALSSLLLSDENTNLFSTISKVVHKKQEALSVFGSDYDTRDGTGIRDYIHVTDLVDAHLLALDFMEKNRGYEVFNLGLGKGCTVLEMVHAYEKVNGVKIALENAPRQAGDLEAVYANPSRAKEMLGWSPKKGLDEIVRDML